MSNEFAFLMICGTFSFNYIARPIRFHLGFFDLTFFYHLKNIFYNLREKANGHNCVESFSSRCLVRWETFEFCLNTQNVIYNFFCPVWVARHSLDSSRNSAFSISNYPDALSQHGSEIGCHSDSFLIRWIPFNGFAIVLFQTTQPEMQIYRNIFCQLCAFNVFAFKFIL